MSRNITVWSCSAAAALAFFAIPFTMPFAFGVVYLVGAGLLALGAPDLVVFPGSVILTAVTLTAIIGTMAHLGPARWINRR